MRKVVTLNQQPASSAIFSQLLVTFGVTILSYLLFGFASFQIAKLVTGIGPEEFTKAVHKPEILESYVTASKIVQAISVIGLFMVPAFVLPKYLFHIDPVKYNGLNRRSPFFLLIVTAFILVSFIPFLEWVTDLNMNMKFPAFMQGVYDWMKSTEDNSDKVIGQMLLMKTPAALIINILLIAVLPAVAEELYFRGYLQRTIYYWLGRRHVAVILTAFIFSFIHFQFFGFFTRMALGVVLGYIYLWSGNLRLSMFFHFLNNLYPIVISYEMQRSGQHFDINQAATYPVAVTILSLVLGCGLMYVFYRYANRPSKMVLTDTEGSAIPIEKWTLAHTTPSPEEAQIIVGSLKSHGIHAVIVNKRDSSYMLFGHAEIYVHPNDLESAFAIIHG